MKEGWEEKKLKEIAKYRRGSFPQPYGNKDWYDGEGSMPFVQVAELQEDSFRMVPITQKRISKIAQPLSVFVPAGTVIVSLQGSIGKVAITDYDSYVDRTIAIFQDYKININKTFFAYQLKIRFEIERIKARGTTIKTITKEEFANFIINVPPLSEQQSIVAYLDSAFAKIDAMKANAEKALNEAKALFQASLKEMLEPKEGWEEKMLKEVGVTQTGTTPSKSDKANYGSYIEFIRPSEIDYDGNGGIDYNCEMKLSEQGASKGRVFTSNSIFMVCIGATIGKVGFSTKAISCNQQINVFTPNNEINYKFAYYAMKSPSFQHRVIKEGTSSQATLPIINKGKWEQLLINYPIIKEQEFIASRLDILSSKVLELQANYDKISQECDALKQSILRQVFE